MFVAELKDVFWLKITSRFVTAVLEAEETSDGVDV